MPRFVCAAFPLPTACFQAPIKSLCDLVVYNPEEVTFICSQEKMRACYNVGFSVEFEPGTPDEKQDEIHNDLCGCDWEDGYYVKYDLDRCANVSDEFESLEDALEFWRGNPPF